MSFVRFGVDGSQVYVYDDVTRGLTCCLCPLVHPDRDRGDRADPAFGTEGHAGLLAHLAAHRDAGHTVPEWVDEEIRADAARLGLDVDQTPASARLLERAEAAETPWEFG